MTNPATHDAAAGTAAADGDDRTIPPALVELAVTAIRHGAHQVSIIHQSDRGLGVPIGWLLWIIHRDKYVDAGAAVPDIISVRLPVTEEQLAAPQWLLDSIAAGTGDAPVCEGLIDLFERGAHHCWEVAYDRKAFDNQMFERVDKRHGSATFTPLHELRAQAFDWAVALHEVAPAGRTCRTVTFAERVGSPESRVAFSDAVSVHARVRLEVAEAMLSNPAPDMIRVARFDDELNEWIK